MPADETKPADERATVARTTPVEETTSDGESGRARRDDPTATLTPTVEHASADAAPELFFE